MWLEDIQNLMVREGGVLEKKSGREDRRREWRDSLTLFCQLTPADLFNTLPIAYGAFKVASSAVNTHMAST